MGELRIRPGERADLPAIDAIYDPYIRETAITFDLEPFGTERREAWFDQFAEKGRHRLLVAEALPPLPPEGRVRDLGGDERLRAT
jgi:phosphinothricin acetyltransferase